MITNFTKARYRNIAGVSERAQVERNCGALRHHSGEVELTFKQAGCLWDHWQSPLQPWPKRLSRTYEPGRVLLRGTYSALPSFFGTTRACLMMQSWVASLRARSSSSRSALNPGRLTFLNSSLTDFSI